MKLVVRLLLPLALLLLAAAFIYKFDEVKLALGRGALKVEMEGRRPATAAASATTAASAASAPAATATHITTHGANSPVVEGASGPVNIHYGTPHAR